MSYLCLTGTWAFIYAENGLKRRFLVDFVNFVILGPTANSDSLDNLGVKCFKS